MKKRSTYDPVAHLYDALGSDDITLEYALMLFGSEREALRIMKHGMSDGVLEVYELTGPVKRYMDVWEVDELVRNTKTSEKIKNKLKTALIALTRKGKRKEKE